MNFTLIFLFNLIVSAAEAQTEAPANSTVEQDLIEESGNATRLERESRKVEKSVAGGKKTRPRDKPTIAEFTYITHTAPTLAL
jgi:hypothetical protein